MASSLDKVLSILADGKPRFSRDVVSKSGLTTNAVQRALYRRWMKGTRIRQGYK